MLSKQVIQISCFIALMAINITVFAHDTDGFYVIAVPTDETIIKEVCNGTPIGNVAFRVYMFTTLLSIGQVFTTESGHVIQITGIGKDQYYGGSTYDFKASVSALPTPTRGSKGPYFLINSGELIYARFL